MREQLRLAHLLLAIAGAMFAHVVGYGLSSSTAIDAAGGHHYLSGVGPWITLGGAVGLGTLAVAGARRANLSDVFSLRTLLGLQLLVFGGQETFERLFAGESLSQLYTETAVLIGFALQPLVALALTAIVRVGARLVAAIGDHRRVAFPQVREFATKAPLVGPSTVLVPAVSERGPPANLSFCSQI